MESLALLASVIILFIIGIGPIALLLSRNSRRGLQITGAALGVIGLIAGFFMLTAVDSTGARVIWAFATVTSGFAIWNAVKRLRP